MWSDLAATTLATNHQAACEWSCVSAMVPGADQFLNVNVSGEVDKLPHIFTLTQRDQSLFFFKLEELVINVG